MVLTNNYTQNPQISLQPDENAHPNEKPKHITLEKFIYNKLFSENWIVLSDTFYNYHPYYGAWIKNKIDQVELKIISELDEIFTLEFDQDTQTYFPNYKYSTTQQMKKCLKYALTSLKPKTQIANQHLIAFKNGTLNLKTNQLEAHNKENYLNHFLPYEYQGSNDEIPPNLAQFLSDSFGKDQVPLIRALISMYIDPQAPYGKFLHIKGQSGSGKGTLIEIICKLIGEAFITSQSNLSLLNKKEDRHSELNGKRLYCVKDFNNDYLKQLGAFYSLVSNESLSARARYGNDSYTQKFNLRFILASCENLKIRNASQGWKRRCIPLLADYRGQPDYNLESKLNDELASIAAWVLSMPKDERDQILFDSTKWPTRNQNAIQESELEDNTVKEFIDCCLIYSDNREDKINQSMLWHFYRFYCLETNTTKLKQTNFNKELQTALEDYYVAEKRTSSARIPKHYTNMKLVDKALFTESYKGYKCWSELLSEGGYKTFFNSSHHKNEDVNY